MSMILFFIIYVFIYRWTKLNYLIQHHNDHEWLNHDQNPRFVFLTVILYYFKMICMKPFCKLEICINIVQMQCKL